MYKKICLLLLSLMLYLPGCDRHSTDYGKSGLIERLNNPTCLAGNAPQISSDVSLTPVYQNLSNAFPLSQKNILIQKPGLSDEDWYIGTIPGMVYKFSKMGDGSDFTPVLDIQDRVADGTDVEPNKLNEGGMLSIAFHPDFNSNGYLYIFYTGFTDISQSSDVKFISHLSRFKSNDNGETFDSESELKLLSINQYSINHKGSTIAFNSDGYLYISIGDDNSANSTQLQTSPTDPLDPHSFRGSMLRIDVDSGSPYGIPQDNPYADGVDGLPEVFAKGFRNPYRWSFDKELGVIYLGDVGSDDREEINLVTMDGNYGWPEREGSICFPTKYPDGIGCLNENDGLTDPVIEYDHSEGSSVLGGYVYRGAQIPALYGNYVFGDFVTQKIWQLRFDDFGSAYKNELVTLPQEAGVWGFLTFSQDNDGELYAISNRYIYKLVQNVGSVSVNTVSSKLSETGCFDENDPKIIKNALIPYGVNTKLWTDGASKERWFALPDNKTIEINTDGTFTFPEGSVLIKNFSLNNKLIETRLLMHHLDGVWAGYSYEWNDQQTEAYLLSEGKTKFVESQNYTYPSRSQCFQCHNVAKSTVIGPEILQLNGMYEYKATGITANQLSTLQAIGVFVNDLDDHPIYLPALPKVDDATLAFSQRFFGYVHANCAYCHQPEGTGRGNIDFRYDVNKTLLDYNLCNVSPTISNLGVAGAKLLTPGNPEMSILSIRLGSTGSDRMPPIGSNYVDTEHLMVIDNYIQSLSICE